MFEPQQFCILSNSYSKIVMESASYWMKMPYDSESARPGWYKKNIFQRIEGVIMRGFKLDWQPKLEISSGNEMVDWFAAQPTESVFIPQSIYFLVQSISTEACVVEATHFGTAKTRHLNLGVIPEFCLVISKFVREIEESELRKIQAIDAFVGGF